jgi:hypothetical protein
MDFGDEKEQLTAMAKTAAFPLQYSRPDDRKRPNEDDQRHPSGEDRLRRETLWHLLQGDSEEMDQHHRVLHQPFN